MGWIYLGIAGLFEVAWAVALHQSKQFSSASASAVFIFCLILSMAFLSLSLRTIPLSIAYAVWTGIGAIGVAAVGMLWLGEPATVKRIIFIALICTGLVGLRLTDGNGGIV